jgi:hypothetical protein
VSANTIVFTRDMGLDHAEFLRVARRALGDQTLGGDTLVVDLGGGRRLTIDLDPTTERRIANISLPSTVVRFCFEGLAPAEADAAMAEWDRTFQRGGG